MLASSLRRAVVPAQRAFSTTTSARKDLVQDLYLAQLRAYKPPQKSADAHAGLVRTFSAPTAPTPPTLPSDLATELSKFDSAEPVLASSAPSKSAQAATAGQDDGAAQGADEYLSFLERDLPKAEAQH